jgi:Fe-coproporphyrin III synthase
VLPLNTASHFLKSWVRPSPVPFKLTLTITERCNGRCLHCGIWKHGTKQDLPLSAVRDIFRQYPHFSWIDLSGGEIFLRSDLLEVIEAIAANTRKLEYLHFPTNALCKNTLDQILEIRRLFKGKLVITVSVDGDQKVNDRVRGIEGSFIKAAGLLRSLFAAELRETSIYAGLTLFAENAHVVPDAFRALAETVPGFQEKHLHVNFAHSASYYKNQNELRPFQGGYDDIALLARQSGISPFALLEKAFRKLHKIYQATGKCPLPCRSGEVSLFIDNSACLRPCAMWDVEGLPLEAFGCDIKRAISSPEFLRSLSVIRNAGCTHCFTACEAYQTMLSSPVKTLGRLILKSEPPR